MIMPRKKYIVKLRSDGADFYKKMFSSELNAD